MSKNPESWTGNCDHDGWWVCARCGAEINNFPCHITSSTPNHVVGHIYLPRCDGVEISPGVKLIGEPTQRADGKLTCLANVNGALCVVELTLRILPPDRS